MCSALHRPRELMDTEVVVRDARLSDHDALCKLWRLTDELHARILPAFFRRSQRPARSLEELEKIVSAHDEIVRVATHATEIVGLVHVQLYDAPPAPQITPRRRAHVDSLVVAEHLRRHGLGQRLMEDAAAWSRQRGAVEILLTVWQGNDTAKRFYEKLGFSVVNTVLGRTL
jgi:diamine N-acetyltransferase